MKKIFDLVPSVFFIIMLIGLYIYSILFSYFVISMDVVSLSVIIMGFIALILYIINSIRQKKFKVWNIIVLIIIFCLYISYENAFDKYVALRGYYGGREGIFAIISYYMFFLYSTTIEKNETKYLFIRIFTLCGILNVLYGLLQVFDIQYIFSVPVARNWSIASGFVYNPDFMGTYMVMLLGFWLPKFLYNDENKICHFILTTIFIFGIMICGTMGSFLTLVMLLILAIIYVLFNKTNLLTKKFFKKFICIAISAMCCFFFVSVFINKDMGDEVSNLGKEVTSTVVGEIDESFGTGRIYIWREAFKYFPKYKYTGIGIDNFAYLGFNDGTFIYDSPAKDTIIYKAHNEYIQILVCEGLFTFIFYMIFLLTIFILAMKRLKYFKGNDLYLSFLFVFCGYLFQAFFNIRIIMIAPIFFVIMGFLVNESVKKEEKK